MQTDSLRVKLEGKNTTTRYRLEEIIRGVKGLQILGPDDSRHANLLIYELGTDTDHDFNHIESLIHTHEVDEVFITAEHADQALLMLAIRTGVKEFLTMPLKEIEVKDALERFKKRQEQTTTVLPMTPAQVITVIGAKGGVGTTTVAVNLAASLPWRKGCSS